MRLFRPALLHDFGMAVISFPLALYLRWGVDFYDYTQEYIVSATLIFAVLGLLAILRQRAHQGLWQYTSLPDVLALLKAAVLSILFFYALLFVLTRLDGLPRTVPLMHFFVLLSLWVGPRALYRMMHRGGLKALFMQPAGKAVPVLLLNANDRAENFLRNMAATSDAQYQVVGIIDERPGMRGRKLQGVTIYGPRSELPRVVEKLARKHKRPRRLVVAGDASELPDLKELLAEIEPLGLGLARLPSTSELRSGAVDAQAIKPVAIEDLLGRAQSAHDLAALKQLIAGKRVLVTGAGGTIGSELVRQIACHAPMHVTLIDHSEFHLYQITQQLRGSANPVAHTALLGDVRDSTAMQRVFFEQQPELVFHAAAIKHVPIAEDNVEEAVLTNVIGTQAVAEAAAEAGAKAMVLISTDKAVNPSSVMGASKRLAESLVQAMAQVGSTKFITVRFGNVLGSTGSVVPLFQQQLAAGGPLTVTHKDMVRYFMTVREAVCLVLEAARMGLDEVEPPIYVLDMGEPVRIEDLALQMIRLAGLEPHKDIQITYTGLRPGEKLFEELFHETEALGRTAHAGISRAKARSMDLGELALQMEGLTELAHSRQREELMEVLHALVPEFHRPV